MIDRPVSQFIRANRGAPLTLLFTLFAFDSPASITELAQATGYTRNTVAPTLRRLAADGYAAEISGRWITTDKARQLSLPGLRDRSTLQENLASGSSSSLVVIEGTASDERELLLPMPKKLASMPKNLASMPKKLASVNHPDRRRLVNFLTDTIGCESRRIAEQAIDTALEDGDSPLSIEHEALWWLAYVHIKKPRIDVPGIFIARKVQNNEQVPGSFEVWPRDIPAIWPLIEDVRRRMEDAERQFNAGRPGPGEAA